MGMVVHAKTSAFFVHPIKRENDDFFEKSTKTWIHYFFLRLFSVSVNLFVRLITMVRRNYRYVSKFAYLCNTLYFLTELNIKA